MAKITIFGLAGTGTSSTGKALAQQLGYTFLSTGNLVRQKAASLGVDLYEFEAMCDKDERFDIELDKDLEQFGINNKDFVVESRLAWHFIPDSFKVKLICDEDERLRRVAHRDGILFDEAKEKTYFREDIVKQKYARIYNIVEYAPDEAFDLIIDTTRTPLDKVLERITEALTIQVERVTSTS